MTDTLNMTEQDALIFIGMQVLLAPSEGQLIGNDGFVVSHLKRENKYKVKSQAANTTEAFTYSVHSLSEIKEGRQRFMDWAKNVYGANVRILFVAGKKSYLAAGECFFSKV